MLQITVSSKELWDEVRQEFINTPEQTLNLEHSLVSISKWESKWHKAFLSKNKKTVDELIDYIRCMTITKNVNPDVYLALSDENLKEINEYIEDPMSASHIGMPSSTANNETVTSELIYYWMVTLNIPFKCETWHINRLLMLIRVCSIKNQPSTHNTSRIMATNAEINRARRKKFGTKG